MAVDSGCQRKYGISSRPTLRQIHNCSDSRLSGYHFGGSVIETPEFCKSTFVNSRRWTSELKTNDYYPTRHEHVNMELCRTRSAHLPRQRTHENRIPRRSVSWADDLVNVHTYTKPRQKRQSGWQLLKRKMSQVMQAIKEDIEFWLVLGTVSPY